MLYPQISFQAAMHCLPYELQLEILEQLDANTLYNIFESNEFPEYLVLVVFNGINLNSYQSLLEIMGINKNQWRSFNFLNDPIIFRSGLVVVNESYLNRIQRYEHSKRMHIILGEYSLRGKQTRLLQSKTFPEGSIGSILAKNKKFRIAFNDIANGKTCDFNSFQSIGQYLALPNLQEFQICLDRNNDTICDDIHLKGSANDFFFDKVSVLGVHSVEKINFSNFPNRNCSIWIKSHYFSNLKYLNITSEVTMESLSFSKLEEICLDFSEKTRQIKNPEMLIKDVTLPNLIKIIVKANDFSQINFDNLSINKNTRFGLISHNHKSNCCCFPTDYSFISNIEELAITTSVLSKSSISSWMSRKNLKKLQIIEPYEKHYLPFGFNLRPFDNYESNEKDELIKIDELIKVHPNINSFNKPLENLINLKITAPIEQEIFAPNLRNLSIIIDSSKDFKISNIKTARELDSITISSSSKKFEISNSEINLNGLRAKQLNVNFRLNL